MRTTNSFGTSDLVLVDKSKKSCHIIDVAIPEDSGVKEKETEKVEKYQNLAREENVGSENQSRIGGFRNSTVAIEGQLKGHRGRHINYFNPEVCTAGISKDTKKSIGNTKDGKNKHCGVPWQLVVARQQNFNSC